MPALGQKRTYVGLVIQPALERAKGIEPSYAAWEAAVLPLNYTREEIFDFRFSIADCNRNKW